VVEVLALFARAAVCDVGLADGAVGVGRVVVADIALRRGRGEFRKGGARGNEKGAGRRTKNLIESLGAKSPTPSPQRSSMTKARRYQRGMSGEKGKGKEGGGRYEQ
jgi:hypothetical protein